MKKLFTCILLGASVSSMAQTAFTNGVARFTGNAHSGVCTAVVDWNGDGLDDIIALDQGNSVVVHVQKTGSQFQNVSLGSFGEGSGWSWGMAVADIDKNGYLDVLAGGYGPAVKILMSNNQGNGSTLVSLPNSNYFLQNVTFGDFNNDGWIDVFCCDDNAAAHVYVNDGAGNLQISGIINTSLNPGINYGGDPADSGNYGSVWTDFDNDGDQDLYVAHCRQSSSDPTDLRRINRMFVNNGDGTFTENAAAYGLNIGWQTWTASFGDIDNDGDFDLMLTNHDYQSQILENDGSGHYTDITATTGFTTSDITPIESVMEDFDNDGFVDLLISGSDVRFFHNNGDKTFTRIDNLMNAGMLTFATGDLNHDGFIDIYSGYGSIYTTPSSIADMLWVNNGNENHFFTLTLKGTATNIGAVGAKAMIYGTWGVQVREVRAGESYGTQNSSQLHFGLGNATAIDSVVIHWPSGIEQTIQNPAIDQFLTITESTCISPEAILSSTGPMVLCVGQDLTLNAPSGAGYSYVWSTGETTPSITVNTEGEYGVRVSLSGNACSSVSKTIYLQIAPDETPSISVNGDLQVCRGSVVVLSGPSNALAYSWSSGQNTQSIDVTQSGSYVLTIQGACQNWTSDPVDITVLAENAPVSQNYIIPVPQSVTLSATGNNLTWYDAPIGGNVLGTGNTYTTPVIQSLTTYYVEGTETLTGATHDVGMMMPSGASQYSGDNNTNAITYFDVYSPVTLVSVRVYTDLPGDRNIQLFDGNGGLVYSQVFTISPDSMDLHLNWSLNPGTNYSISTDASYNQVIPNNNGGSTPRLKRNNVGGVYPYTLNGRMSITGNSIGSQYYYYFYDWKVQDPSMECTTERTEVNVDLAVSAEENSLEGFGIYPNPTAGKFEINTTQFQGTIARVLDLTGRTLHEVELKSAKTELNLVGLSAGIYQVSLENEQGRRTEKLVIR
ncbi:MAG: FG-GAP-like repeat-containing protein [Bacteroidia bacterium]|nr:FG-GAP-like repeat-containing protein [Bacteroidia bacterium]